MVVDDDYAVSKQDKNYMKNNTNQNQNSKEKFKYFCK